jgi:hypothetical protein
MYRCRCACTLPRYCSTTASAASVTAWYCRFACIACRPGGEFLHFLHRGSVAGGESLLAHRLDVDANPSLLG